MNLKGVAYAGAGLLVIGLFTPIIQIPIAGNVNLFANGTNVSALCLMALAAIAAGLTLKDREADLVWPGLAAGIVVLYRFGSVEYMISSMRASAAKALAGNPFASMAQAAFGTIQIQWGWLVLALGVGLLIFVGTKGRALAIVGGREHTDSASRIIGAVSALFLLVAIGWDWLPGHGDAATDTSPTAAFNTSNSLSPSTPSDKSSAEETAYAATQVKLYDFKAKYYQGYDGRQAGVDFKLKNLGDKILNRVTVKVVFLDNDGKPIAEESYDPVIVTEFSFGNDNKPLKPNYVWQNEPDKFLTAKSVPSEWKAGSATASVVSVEFATDKGK